MLLCPGTVYRFLVACLATAQMGIWRSIIASTRARTASRIMDREMDIMIWIGLLLKSIGLNYMDKVESVKRLK
jgi:hypothetical protein